MKKVKILFLGSQMTIGGAQRVLLDQAQWFYAHGNDVFAAFLYDRDGLSYQWQTNHSFPIVNLNAWHPKEGVRNIPRLISGIFKLYSLLRREQFDIIETFAHHANILGLPTAWFARSSVRLASHHGWGEGLSSLLKRLHKFIINSAITSGLVVVSKNSGVHAEKVEGVIHNKITIIPNGIDPSAIISVDRSKLTHLNDDLCIPLGAPIILSVGRLALPKGHKYLLEAVPPVLEKYPEAIFVLAGDGPLKQDLQQIITGLGIKQAVRLIGARSDIPALLNWADVFALPSLSEGLPISLLEAMSAGLPVVVSQVGGISEVIEDGINGLLVPPSDSAALGSSIIRLLSNPGLRVELGVAAKSLVEHEYTLDQMGNKYQSLFHKLLGANSRGTP